MKKEYKVIDIDALIIVELEKRKDILDCLNEYCDNFNYDWFDASDETFEILYNDGTFDYIDESYNGHKIKKVGISSLVYSNPSTYMVFGNYEINDCGVVTTSFDMIIDNTNIKEI